MKKHIYTALQLFTWAELEGEKEEENVSMTIFTVKSFKKNWLRKRNGVPANKEGRTQVGGQ